MCSSSSWLRLAHRTACVTGAGSGIGRAVAAALAVDGGCNVLLADADASAVEAAAGAIASRIAAITPERSDGSTRNTGHESSVAGPTLAPACRVEPIICDVTNAEQVQKMIGAADALASAAAADALASAAAADASTSAAAGSAADQMQSVPAPPVASILVNCAGITRDALIGSMSVESFDDVVGVNLRGTWLTCKYFCADDRLRRLLQEEEEEPTSISASTDDRGASIINIGSVVSRTGNVGQSNYGASKGGVVGLTRSLAKEMARCGVRANAILPGFIDTNMAQAVPEHIRDGIQRKIPLRSFGRPEDIANLALFLASPERSRYITGETIECSGMIAL